MAVPIQRKVRAYHEAGHAVLHVVLYCQIPKAVFVCPPEKGEALTGTSEAEGGCITSGFCYNTALKKDNEDICELRDPSCRGEIAASIAVCLAGEQGRQVGFKGQAQPFFDLKKQKANGGIHDLECVMTILRAWKPKARLAFALDWVCGLNAWILEQHESQLHGIASMLMKSDNVNSEIIADLWGDMRKEDYLRALCPWFNWANKNYGCFESDQVKRALAKQRRWIARPEIRR